MSVGSFTAALIQRSIEAAGGAERGKVVGQERARANARQAHEDALNQAMIESRLKTEGLQQHELDPAVIQRRAEASVAASLARIRAQHTARIEEIKAQGETARAVARVRAANGGNSDPRVGVLTHKIADFTRRGEQARKTAGDLLSTPPVAAAADSTARAMDDSVTANTARRDRIVGLSGDTDPDAAGGPGNPKSQISQEDYDALTAEGYTRAEIANDFDVSGVQ